MAQRNIFETIRVQFRQRALEPETLFLLAADDAVIYLDAMVAAGFGLAGVEGFLVTKEGAFQPHQEFSNDASEAKGSAEEFLLSTRELIAEGARHGMYFQVVVEGEGAYL